VKAPLVELRIVGPQGLELPCAPTGEFPEKGETKHAACKRSDRVDALANSRLVALGHVNGQRDHREVRQARTTLAPVRYHMQGAGDASRCRPPMPQ
jgi:hypothetical protein